MRGTAFIVWSVGALVATSLIPITAQHWTPPADMATLHAVAVVTYLADLLAVFGIVFGLGFAITGRIAGIALSTYNDFSLVKLQTALWTIVVLSAALTTARLNLLDYFGPMPITPDTGGLAGPDRPAEPLDISIPGELLAAMGIAAFSTAAVPAILALKAGQASTCQQQANASRRVQRMSGVAASDMMPFGQVAGHRTISEANWTDIVTGDELANTGTVDLSKVQQLLVTLMLLGTYIFLLIRGFATAPPQGMTELPGLSPRFIELLAISHAGYLVYKAAPKGGQAGPDMAMTVPGMAMAAAVPVRVAIHDAATVTGMSFTLDGNPVVIGASGLADVSVFPGIAHRFSARGLRAGEAVAGSMTRVFTAGDSGLALAIVLTRPGPA